MKHRKRLGDMLVERDVISEFELSAALNDQRRWGNRLGTSLIRLGFIHEETLTKFLATQYGLPGVDLKKETPEPEALKTLSPELALERVVLPLAICEDEGGRQVLEIAFGDPRNLECLDEIRFMTNYPLRIRLASDHAIVRAINKHYFGKEEEEERAEDSISIHTDAPDASMVIIRSIDAELAEARDAPLKDAKSAGPAATNPSDGPGSGPAVAGKPRRRAGDRPDPSAESLRAVRALARVLVRKKIVTPEELLAEFRKK